ncbi:hypothetical protein HK102_011024 [Quaeritorhiza haematococci]|nr:hypothetical protein HK102_011024 [Quaeritorhiza haematococci]
MMRMNMTDDEYEFVTRNRGLHLYYIPHVFAELQALANETYQAVMCQKQVQTRIHQEEQSQETASNASSPPTWVWNKSVVSLNELINEVRDDRDRSARLERLNGLIREAPFPPLQTLSSLVYIIGYDALAGLADQIVEMSENIRMRKGLPLVRSATQKFAKDNEGHEDANGDGIGGAGGSDGTTGNGPGVGSGGMGGPDKGSGNQAGAASGVEGKKGVQPANAPNRKPGMGPGGTAASGAGSGTGGGAEKGGAGAGGAASGANNAGAGGGAGGAGARGGGKKGAPEAASVAAPAAAEDPALQALKQWQPRVLSSHGWPAGRKTLELEYRSEFEQEVAAMVRGVVDRLSTLFA